MHPQCKQCNIQQFLGTRTTMLCGGTELTAEVSQLRFLRGRLDALMVIQHQCCSNWEILIGIHLLLIQLQKMPHSLHFLLMWCRTMMLLSEVLHSLQFQEVLSSLHFLLMCCRAMMQLSEVLNSLRGIMTSWWTARLHVHRRGHERGSEHLAL
jgi:hypothetical protein